MEKENDNFRKRVVDQIAELSLMIDQLTEDNKRLNQYIEKHMVRI